MGIEAPNSAGVGIRGGLTVEGYLRAVVCDWPVPPEMRIGIGPNSDGLFQELIALGARVEVYEASVRAIRRH